MKKFSVFSTTIFIAIILAGLYGLLHDQVTYSLSFEYYTKFKYQQFGLEPVSVGGDRQAVAIIGFMATWWMGLFIGIILGLISLISRDHIIMRSLLVKGITIVFITAIVFAIAGFLYGKYYLIQTGVNWWIPDDLVDRNAFITVGSIHNFSYIGGIVGLALAVIFMIRKNILLNRKHATN